MPSFGETQAEARRIAQLTVELHDEAFRQYLRTQVKLPRFGPMLVPLLPPVLRPSDAMLRRYRDA